MTVANLVDIDAGISADIDEVSFYVNIFVPYLRSSTTLSNITVQNKSNNLSKKGGYCVTRCECGVVIRG